MRGIAEVQKCTEGKRQKAEKRKAKSQEPRAKRQEARREESAMDTLIRDIRYGLRMLRKSPALTLVAALSLALGIGANSAIFTVVNAIFLNPLPVQEPERLVSVFTTDQRNRRGFAAFLPNSEPNF